MDGKICQNIKPLTPRRIPSSVQLSTWGRLEDKATKFLHFLFMLTILKSFLNKTKFKCFNKISIVFILTALGRSKFYKVWNTKGSVKKRKTSNNRSRVFKIALEGGSRVCQLAYAAYVHMPTFTGVRMILDMVIWTRTLIFFPYDFLKIYFSGRYNFMLFKIYCYIFDL